MGMATLNDHRFRLDPMSISWSYAIKAKDFKAVGGKVVQVYGANIKSMTIRGSFGVGGWQEQAQFLDKMKALASSQIGATTSLTSTPDPKPLRFQYPPNGWDFLVYLTDFKQEGAGTSVFLSDQVVAPGWVLVFSIIEDNAGLRTVAMDSYLSRIAQGLGWKQTDYNGPMTQAEMMDLVGGNVGTYLTNYFGLPAGPTTPGQVPQ